MRRGRMGRRSSKRNFRRASSSHRLNRHAFRHGRGGIRL